MAWTLGGQLGTYLGVGGIANIEVPSDIKEERVMGSRGGAYWKIFWTTPFKYQRNAFLAMKIRPFPDKKKQLSLLFSEVPSNVLIFADLSIFEHQLIYYWGAVPLALWLHHWFKRLQTRVFLSVASGKHSFSWLVSKFISLYKCVHCFEFLQRIRHIGNGCFPPVRE